MWKRVFWSVLGLGFLPGLMAQKAEDYRITHLPGIDVNTLPSTQYAGHVEISPETNGHLFFWMIEQAQTTSPDKLIIWLNGGPGCSSMDGLFLENGPFRVNKDMSLSVSPGGWQDYATTVFLDQPVGTGFSFAETISYTKNLTQIAKDFTVFLDEFFEIFPDLKSKDMYIAGESYAGTYIPYIASLMLDQNAIKEREYNLKGIAIGNGWISPRHHYDAIYDFGVQNNILVGPYKALADKHLDRCHTLLDRSSRISIETCEQLMSDILDSSTYEEKGQQYCVNQYDIRIKNEEAPMCGQTWPHELTQVTEYLRLPELVSSIHAKKQSLGWVECARGVSYALDDDKSPPSFDLLPSILKEIPILLFSGEYDLICNHLGTEYMIGNMTWNGKQGFKSAKSEDWFMDDKVVGQYTEDRNLTYVLIKDGSHMVPYDKPLETLDMINRFIGAGDNSVVGKSSRVGPSNGSNGSKPPQPAKPQAKPTTSKTQDESKTKTPEENEEKPKEPTDKGTPEDETKNSDYWEQYYSWGTSALIFVILFAALLGYCWYRSRKQDRGNYSSAPSRSTQAPSRGIMGRIAGFFTECQVTPKPKFRLNDPYDDNELEELVVETPTLFVAEESDGEDHPNSSTSSPSHAAGSAVRSSNNTSPSRFAANYNEDNTDDDFDDFADWDESSSLVDVDHKQGKKH
ncbi:serine carboxypeptidase-domain-containing protein [Phycomyces blakesleeanus]